MDLKLWVGAEMYVLLITHWQNLLPDWKTLLVFFFCFLFKKLAGLLWEVFVVCVFPSLSPLAIHI